nr:myosin heavy chain IB-like [Equus asinus]
MTAPGSGGGSGARGSASRSRSPGPGRAALGAAALLCIDTVHARGSSYPRRARLGEDGGGGRGRDGRGGAGARRLRGSERGRRASSPSVRGGRVVRMGHPGEGRLRIGAKLEALPASQRGTVVEGNGMRAAALPASSAAPTLCPSPGRMGEASQAHGTSAGSSSAEAKCAERWNRAVQNALGSAPALNIAESSSLTSVEDQP